MKPEILAPVGNEECLKAAVRCGADAVYFGTGNFNARRNAENFDSDRLKQAVDYCHLHSVKCHVTLNTLVSDSELDEVVQTVRRICQSGADAVIVQDLGVAHIVREICPDIEMHASTQLSTGTPEGLKLLRELGFTRAVLPRELSEKEISVIAADSPLELEMFVHGALCMSVSGQCLLSAMLGSRSGNRGLCAQPCRLPFCIEGGTGNDLSLKDLSLIDRLPLLHDMGVKSFKIEGRMKRPEYVAAAVTACREALSGDYTQTRRDELKSLFSRSGFTTGYFDGRLGRDMFGSRMKQDVTAATNELLKKYEKLYEKEKPVYSVDFFFTAHNGEKPTLSAKAESKSVFVEGASVCEKAINRSLDSDTVTAQLSKCGGTVFACSDVTSEIDDGISVPLSAVNALRREALEKLSASVAQRKPYTLLPYCVPKRIHKPKASERKLYLVFDNKNQIPDGVECDMLFLPLNEKNAVSGNFDTGVVLPRGLFFNSREIEDKLNSSPFEFVLCNTLDAVAIARNVGKTVVGGPFLNLFNSEAVSKAEDLGVSQSVLSYELTVRQISSISSGVPTGCVVYGRTPLMLTRNCPVKNGKSCAQCSRSSSLTDRKGISFPVRCTNGFSELFNSRPVYMLDRLDEIRGTDFDMLVFTVETEDEVRAILKAYHNRSTPEAEFTRGLFYRGVE